MSSCVSAFQIFAVPSNEAVETSFESGLKFAAKSRAEWPESSLSYFAVASFHSSEFGIEGSASLLVQAYRERFLKQRSLRRSRFSSARGDTA